MRANALLPLMIVLGQILGGCTVLSDDESVAAAASTRLEERRALFDQPYIDPLTRYLETHGDDPRYAEVLTAILVERDRRCAAIADEYTQRPVNRETLARYRRGYLYSCPADVNAFHARVRAQDASRATTAPQPEEEPESEEMEEDEVAQDSDALDASVASLAERDKRVEESLERRQRNDCYLLFTIRNLGEAREACREPAEQGDARAQRHMGSMAEIKGNRQTAVRWYRQAVDNGDAKAGERLEALTATVPDAKDIDVDIEDAGTGEAQ
ncbi:MAG: sel1 repeat family protein [Halomonas sp.]|uniref:hypothetical protein n=1 Tax=Halomonas sp. TaxID=1486246 RepID=UPI0017E10B2E|nr:hypothetical protein [Halomonas sp.]NWN81418.1 sel1 repeat family protein [Halomonas sp.]